MKVFILGGTGFIGKYLVDFFYQRGVEVFLLVRNIQKIKEVKPGIKIIQGDALVKGYWQEKISEMDLIINLVGETIFKRWTPEYKKKIWDSRILSTQRVVEALTSRNTLFNASAIGYYGDRGETILTEDNPSGDLYISHLCKTWEEIALKGEDRGARIIVGRLGIVIGKGGGFLSTILPLFKLGLGGRLGSGKQWISWIHIEDLARVVEFLYEKDVEGIFNITSPQPIRSLEMTKIIANVLRKPAILPTPKTLLKFFYGELSEVILSSTRAIPKKLMDLDFTFKYPTFREALTASL
ncbi:MAG: TIGR01777 family oxidoreductase [Nitrososphaerota archaeon]